MRFRQNELRQSELRRLSLFSDARRSELALVSRLLTQLTVPAGRVLVREGAPGSEFMIVSEGEAVVSQGGKTIATIGRGDLVGEMALLHENGRGTRNATVRAVSDLTLYVGSPAEFRRILDVAPSVAEKVRQTSASRTPVAA